MIKSGEKKEEYREVTNHWHKRLCNGALNIFDIGYKEFDTVTFTNGYSPISPRIEIEFKGITVRTGKQEWGAESGKKYFVIKLGKILTHPQA